MDVVTLNLKDYVLPDELSIIYLLHVHYSLEYLQMKKSRMLMTTLPSSNRISQDIVHDSPWLTDELGV